MSDGLNTVAFIYIIINKYEIRKEYKECKKKDLLDIDLI